MIRFVGLMVITATALFALSESQEVVRYARWYRQWR
jgi:hypothetical protein